MLKLGATVVSWCALITVCLECNARCLLGQPNNDRSTVHDTRIMCSPQVRTKSFLDFDFDFSVFNLNLSCSDSTENSKTMKENFYEVFESLDRNLRSLGDVQETIDLMVKESTDAVQPVPEGMKHSKEEIIAEADDVGKRVDRNFGYLLEVFKMTSKTYNAVEKTRQELLEEFRKSLEYAKSSRIESTLVRMNNFILFFSNEKARISQLSRNERIAMLSEENGFLQYLRESRTPSGDSLQTFLYEVINKKYAIPETADDNIAYAALSSMYYGVVTFISMLRYMTRANVYLSDHYYRNRDIDKFNRQVDHMIGDFKSFRDTLIGERGLIHDAIHILKEAAGKGFTRNEEGCSPEDLLKRSRFLEHEQLQLKYDTAALPIIQEIPDKLNTQFKFDSKSLPTPIGPWKDGAKVSYAVQYAKSDGSFSKVGEWSEPFTVKGRANPCLRLPAKSTYTRIIVRKFNNDKPQFVGVWEPSRQGEFRDIDSDLFYAASGPDESLAIAEAAAYIGIGANAEALFDLGRSAAHAAATNGNTELARKLLLNDSVSINIKDANDYTPLHLAAEGGWTGFVEMMVNQGSDINAKTKAGSTPLHLAVSKGYVDVAEAILQIKDVDVNAQDKKGAGPLHLAVLHGHGTLLSALLADDRTNVNLQTNGNFTPLHLSILMDSHESIKKLIADHRTRINIRSKGKLTALHFGAITGNMPAMQMLVDLDTADLDPQSVNGWTPLHYAVYTKQQDLVSVLLELEHLNVDVPSDGHITPLHIAAVTDQSEVIKGLLSHGATIDLPNSGGLTALHLAAMNGNQQVLTTLLEMNADVNARNHQGSTVLHLVAPKGDSTAVKNILEKGRCVQINRQNNEGLTALHLAALNNHNDVMEILLNKGADCNVRNNRGSTVLHLMATKGDLIALKNILGKAQGLQIDLQNNEGLTALHLAAVSNHEDVMVLLLQKGADINAVTMNGTNFFSLTAGRVYQQVERYILDSNGRRLNVRSRLEPFLQLADPAVGLTEFVKSLSEKLSKICKGMVEAAKGGKLDEVKSLVLSGADLEFKDNDGKTALTWAARRGDLETVKYLLEKGALVEAKDNYGWTALVWAARNGYLDTVKLLVEKGARVDTKTKDGWTAMMGAAKWGHLNIVQYLLANGAQLNAKDNKGRTALYWANELDRTEVANYLKSKGAIS